MLYLSGLRDDYRSDGRVITPALSRVPLALAATEELAKGYAQINSSVGQFATDTLLADTNALASGSAADPTRSACKSAVSARRASPVRHLFTVRSRPYDSAADANGGTADIITAASDG